MVHEAWLDEVVEARVVAGVQPLAKTKMLASGWLHKRLANHDSDVMHGEQNDE